ALWSFRASGSETPPHRVKTQHRERFARQRHKRQCEQPGHVGMRSRPQPRLKRRLMDGPDRKRDKERIEKPAAPAPLFEPATAVVGIDDRNAGADRDETEIPVFNT